MLIIHTQAEQVLDLRTLELAINASKKLATDPVLFFAIVLLRVSC